MVCFSRMVNAIPHNAGAKLDSSTMKQPEHGLTVDVEFLAHIMRSACHLLRYMNESSEHPQSADMNWSSNSPIENSDESSWFQVGEQMDKFSSIGFPVYTLNMTGLSSFSREAQHQSGHSSSTVPDHVPIRSLTDDHSKMISGSELGQVLASKWFQQFLETTFDQSYPLDRFTCLIALWIVADICGCNSLGRLMSELVDQIFHEESNSCNLEELLQLGAQVGSYWLSYHRRHRASFAKASATSIDDDDDDDDVEEEEEEEEEAEDRESVDESDSGGRFSSGVDSQRLGTEVNSRAKLRRIIRAEFLEGPNCPLCGSRALEPLSCLRPRQSCARCPHTQSTSREADFCALSRRRLPLLRLELTLRQMHDKRLLTFVSQSEWVRRAILAGGGRRGHSWLPGYRETTTTTHEGEPTMFERIDIEANFERLTMIRGEPQPGAAGGEERDDDEPEEEENVSEMDSTLAAFMQQESTTPKSGRRNWSASESIRMLRFIVDSSGRIGPSGSLFLCASDVLVLDQVAVRDDWRRRTQQQQMVQLRLMTADCCSRGSLWICSSRSPISKLRLGCGRLFGSLELLARSEATTSQSLDGFNCCFCQRELQRVHSLPDADLQWPTKTSGQQRKREIE